METTTEKFEPSAVGEEFEETAGAADPEAECIMYVAPDGRRIRMTVAEYRERGL